MAKQSAKSRSKKSDILIKANATSSRILEISQNGIRIEMTNKGTITGKYRGIHWDTVEIQWNLDGTSSWEVKMIEMTDKGDMLVGTGSGTGEPPNSRGIAKLRGEGTIMTASPRLLELNGKRWVCEVDNNVLAGKAQVAVNFQ